jgi:hypothetical protein
MSPRPLDGDADDRLRAERPVPRPAFRGALRRHVGSMQSSGAGRPRRLGLLIALYGGAGAALLVLGTAGLLGAGPFAP